MDSSVEAKRRVRLPPGPSVAIVEPVPTLEEELVQEVEQLQMEQLQYGLYPLGGEKEEEEEEEFAEPELVKVGPPPSLDMRTEMLMERLDETILQGMEHSYSEEPNGPTQDNSKHFFGVDSKVSEGDAGGSGGGGSGGSGGGVGDAWQGQQGAQGQGVGANAGAGKRGDDGAGGMLRLGGFKLFARGYEAAPDFIGDDSEGSASRSGGGSGAAGSSAASSYCRSNLIAIEEIGRGSSGTIHKALHVPTMTLVAVKVCQVLDGKRRNYMLRELQTLHKYTKNSDQKGADGVDGKGPQAEGDGQWQIPHAVKLLDAFYDPPKAQVALVMELMDAGSVGEILAAGHQCAEDVVAKVAHCALSAVSSMHRGGLIHRDLKPSKLLINRAGQVKLAGFGLTTSVAGENLGDCSDKAVGSNTAGKAGEAGSGFSSAALDLAKTYTITGKTNYYLSPERLSSAGYTASADIWSIGVVICSLALGHVPWPVNDGNGYWGFIDALLRDAPPRLADFETDGDDADGGGSLRFSPALHDFVALCLQSSPDARPTAEEMLQHPFVTENYVPPVQASPVPAAPSSTQAAPGEDSTAPLDISAEVPLFKRTASQSQELGQNGGASHPQEATQDLLAVSALNGTLATSEAAILEADQEQLPFAQWLVGKVVEWHAEHQSKLSATQQAKALGITHADLQRLSSQLGIALEVLVLAFHSYQTPFMNIGGGLAAATPAVPKAGGGGGGRNGLTDRTGAYSAVANANGDIIMAGDADGFDDDDDGFEDNIEYDTEKPVMSLAGGEDTKGTEKHARSQQDGSSVDQQDGSSVDVAGLETDGNTVTAGTLAGTGGWALSVGANGDIAETLTKGSAVIPAVIEQEGRKQLWMTETEFAEKRKQENEDSHLSDTDFDFEDEDDCVPANAAAAAAALAAAGGARSGIDSATSTAMFTHEELGHDLLAAASGKVVLSASTGTNAEGNWSWYGNGAAPPPAAPAPPPGPPPPVPTSAPTATPTAVAVADDTAIEGTFNEDTIADATIVLGGSIPLAGASGSGISRTAGTDGALDAAATAAPPVPMPLKAASASAWRHSWSRVDHRGGVVFSASGAAVDVPAGSLAEGEVAVVSLRLDDVMDVRSNRQRSIVVKKDAFASSLQRQQQLQLSGTHGGKAEFAGVATDCDWMGYSGRGATQLGPFVSVQINIYADSRHRARRVAAGAPRLRKPVTICIPHAASSGTCVELVASGAATNTAGGMLAPANNALSGDTAGGASLAESKRRPDGTSASSALWARVPWDCESKRGFTTLKTSAWSKAPTEVAAGDGDGDEDTGSTHTSLRMAVTAIYDNSCWGAPTHMVQFVLFMPTQLQLSEGDTFKVRLVLTHHWRLAELIWRHEQKQQQQAQLARLAKLHLMDPGAYLHPERYAVLTPAPVGCAPTELSKLELRATTLTEAAGETGLEGRVDAATKCKGRGTGGWAGIELLSATVSVLESAQQSQQQPQQQPQQQLKVSGARQGQHKGRGQLLAEISWAGEPLEVTLCVRVPEKVGGSMAVGGVEELSEQMELAFAKGLREKARAIAIDGIQVRRKRQKQKPGVRLADIPI
jgi:serine/threonine protein kinase